MDPLAPPRPRFWDRLWSRPAPKAAPDLVPALNGNGHKAASGVSFVGNPDWRSVIRFDQAGLDRDATELTRATAFATAAYCYTAMEWRARRVAEPPLMVVRETPEGEEWVPEHPLAELLDQPRPDVDMAELLDRTQRYRDLTGACLWVLDRRIGFGSDGSRPIPAFITPFSGHEFRSQAQGEFIYGTYQVRTQAGQWTPVDRADVIHFRDVNPNSWRETVSRVDAALINLNLGHTVTRIVSRFVSQAMFPGGIISPHPEWHPSEEEWTLWKELVEAWHNGPANSGKNLYTPGGTTFSRVASGLVDLIPAPILDRVEATVASVFGLTPVVLGWLTGLQNSPWSQMAEARTQSYEDTIEPLWRDMERRIGRVLLTPAERAAGLLIRFDTSKVRALQADEEQRSRISQNNADIWTVGERRLFTGKDLLEDDRDDLIPGLVEPAPADALGQGDPPPDPNADPAAAPPEPGKASRDTRDLLWLLYDGESKAAEPGWERAIFGHLTWLKGQVADAAQRLLEPIAAKAGLTPGSEDAFQHELGEILEQSRTTLVALTHPLLLKTGGRAVGRLAGRLRLSFQVLEPGLAKYASREAAFLARVMGETTGQAVAATVQKGLSAGETIADLVKRLEDLPAFDRTRAKLVARTETTRAWNGAQRTSLSEYSKVSGRQAVKQWLSARDDRVREEHQALDGEERPIDAPFSNGLLEPGEPNCRCTLIYSLAEEA